MDPQVSHVAAFVAGLLSFTSPCVLPLVPIYLAHLAGVGVGETGLGARARVIVNAVAFVSGFSIIFVLLGATIGAADSVLSVNRVWLVRAGGVLLVVMGLHLVGLIRIPLLDREYRFPMATRVDGAGRAATSLVIGAAFGASWTPCVGPILGAILTMAAGEESAGDSALLLAVYAAGFAVPFLAAASAIGLSRTVIRALSGRLALINSVSGAFILALGVVLLLGIYEELFADLARVAPWRPWEPTV